MQYQIEAGDSLSAIAATILGSGDYWRELAQLNDLSPIEALPIGTNIEIPELEQVINIAKPVLSDITDGLNFASDQIGLIADIVPGYAREALAAINEANGVVGEVERVLSDAGEAVRGYNGNESVKIVDWLLQ